MVNTIISVSGSAGSGKDAYADALERALLQHDIVFEHLAFADALKEELHALTGIPLEHFYNATIKEEWRTLLQGWGDYRRNGPKEMGCGLYYWTTKVTDRIQASDADVFIVPDCRYPHEIAAMASGAIWSSNKEVRSIRVLIDPTGYTPTAHSSHSSEKPLPPSMSLNGKTCPTFTDSILNDHSKGLLWLQNIAKTQVENWIRNKQIISSYPNIAR